MSRPPVDPTGVIPPDALRFYLGARARPGVDPTGVVPLGPDSYQVLVPLLMDPLTSTGDGAGKPPATG